MFELGEDDFWIRRGSAAQWTRTGHPLVPLAARVPPTGGPDVLRESWVIEIGDFPDEPLYALYVDGACVGRFSDWPARWTPLDEAAPSPGSAPWWAEAIALADPRGPEPWPYPSRHAPFLHAIAAAPDEETPRALYADWLESEGQEARAAFIRLELGLPHDTEQTSYAHPLTFHYADPRWGARPPAWCWWHPLSDFDRGFIGRLWLLGLDLAFLPEYLRSPYLIPGHVRLEGGTLHGRPARALASPMLAATRTLHLFQVQLYLDAVDALIASPHLDRLQALVLEDCDVARDPLRRLQERFGRRLHHLRPGWLRVETDRGGTLSHVDFHDRDEAIAFADDTASERDEEPFPEATVLDSRLEEVDHGVHYGYRQRMRREADASASDEPPPMAEEIPRQPADAWAFRCDLSASQALEALRKMHLSWRWHVVDDTPSWRKMIISRADEVGGFVLLRMGPPAWLAEVVYPSSVSPHAMLRTELEATLRSTVLPALGARDIKAAY